MATAKGVWLFGYPIFQICWPSKFPFQPICYKNISNTIIGFVMIQNQLLYLESSTSLLGSVLPHKGCHRCLISYFCLGNLGHEVLYNWIGISKECKFICSWKMFHIDSVRCFRSNFMHIILFKARPPLLDHLLVNNLLDYASATWFPLCVPVCVTCFH